MLPKARLSQRHGKRGAIGNQQQGSIDNVRQHRITNDKRHPRWWRRSSSPTLSNSGDLSSRTHFPIDLTNQNTSRKVSPGCRQSAIKARDKWIEARTELTIVQKTQYSINKRTIIEQSSSNHRAAWVRGTSNAAASKERRDVGVACHD
jgi:hypothetical protein